jgi:uncharacterized protein DUF6919
MAAWLERDSASRPGYQPRYGPDEETTDLIPVLAACNRAGFLTDDSQPGVTETGYDGALWEQRPAVTGFVARDNHELLQRLAAAADQAGLLIELHIARDPWDDQGGIAVTTRDGKRYTTYGRALSGDDLWHLWTSCHRQAVNQIIDAVQVTLAYPLFGPNQLLWEVLAEVTARPVPPPPAPAPAVVCSACGCTAINWQMCNDGCHGVTNHDDGRCQACIDPGVIIDWSQVRDDEPNNCALCDAPYYHAGDYCSPACREADTGDEDDEDGDMPVPTFPAAPTLPGYDDPPF